MLKQFKHLSEFFPKHQRIVDYTSGHKMPHKTYSKEDAQNLKVQHIKPQNFADWSALFTAKYFKTVINLVTRYNISPMTQKRWLTKTLLLETLSVVPGMVGSMCRHMRSLRLFRKDNGWIQQLLQEADNQRFHYFTILSLRKPGYIARITLGLLQGIFVGQVFLGYILSARHAHKFVGYLEQDAFKHYTEILRQIDRKGSPLFHWGTKTAPQQVIEYYKLDKNATQRDMILMIRADELCHNELNHFLGEVDKSFDINKQQDMMYKNQQKDAPKEKIQGLTMSKIYVNLLHLKIQMMCVYTLCNTCFKYLNFIQRQNNNKTLFLQFQYKIIN